jgi:hypothetical protein
MKRWLESLGDNERAVTWLSRVFGVFSITFFLLLAYNYGATRELSSYTLPSWLYFLCGIPSLVLLLVFIGLQTVERKYKLPPPTPVDLERERLAREALAQKASRDLELALEAETLIFALLKEHNIAFAKSPMSAMAEDMGGKFYTFECPLVLPKDFIFPNNPVLETEHYLDKEVMVVTRFTIASSLLHTYATFYTPNADLPKSQVN